MFLFHNTHISQCNTTQHNTDVRPGEYVYAGTDNGEVVIFNMSNALFRAAIPVCIAMQCNLLPSFLPFPHFVNIFALQNLCFLVAQCQ